MVSGVSHLITKQGLRTEEGKGREALQIPFVRLPSDRDDEPKLAVNRGRLLLTEELGRSMVCQCSFDAMGEEWAIVVREAGNTSLQSDVWSSYDSNKRRQASGF